jgi:hypothetical protein
MLGNAYKIKPCQLNMTILMITRGEGFTKDIYENARKEVNWEGNPPPGMVLHAASFDNSGNIRVADVWESEDQWNNFLNTRLMPYMQKAKVPPLNTEIFQIHNINALPGLDSYKLR